MATATPDHLPTADKRPFVFIHIWKTGGTSLHRFLAGILPGYRMVDAHTRITAAAWLSSFPYIGGHFLWEQVAHTAVDGARTASVLRDPVERTLSQFSFNRRYQDEFALQGGDRGPLHLALQRVLDRKSAEQLCLISNLQTGILAGHARGSADPRERLGVAQENLTRIDFVGVTENLGAFRSAMAAGLGRADPPDVPHENRTPARLLVDDLSGETRELLHEANRLDTELYQFALRRGQGMEIRSTRAAPAGGLDAYGNRACLITSIHAEEQAGVITIQCVLYAVEAGEYNAGFLLVDGAAFTVCGTNTAALGRRLELAAGERRVLDFSIQLNLRRGEYAVYCEVRDEFSVCHRPLAGAVLYVASEAQIGVGLCRPLVTLA